MVLADIAWDPETGLEPPDLHLRLHRHLHHHPADPNSQSAASCPTDSYTD